MADVEKWMKSLRRSDRIEFDPPNSPALKKSNQDSNSTCGCDRQERRQSDINFHGDQDGEEHDDHYHVKKEDYENGFRSFWHSVFSDSTDVRP